MLDAALVCMKTRLDRAFALANAQREHSVNQLAEWVRIPSLTGEEEAGQAHMRELLAQAGADVHESQPDIEAMFAAYPDVAQYPTHCQHDLILPYTDLPTWAALESSGLRTVLN